MTFLERNRVWAEGVIGGSIPAGKLMKAAASRFLRDCEQGEAKGFFWDEAAAEEIVYFCGLIRHYKGEWAGRVWTPEPWQIFILTNIFGWKLRATGKRRFRKAYVEVPRKNGKTFLGAAVTLYGLTLDCEPGAEIYSVATKKDQAKLLLNDAVRMVGQSASLRKLVKTFKASMVCERLAAKFEPLGRDSKSLDGLNPHIALLDELHAWRDADLYDVISGAFGARSNYLLMAITTAGFNTSGICYERRGHGEKVLTLPGEYDDEELFVFIAAADEGDDPFAPETWAKANPNLGVSKKWEAMAKAAEEAKRLPRARAEFLAKQLNRWVNAAKSWLVLEQWRRCAMEVPDSTLRGCECWGGFDLAPVNDLSTLVLVFLLPSGRHAVRVWCWCPEANVEERSTLNGVPYRAWAEAGHIRRTDGEVTDFEAVKNDVKRICDEWKPKGIAYDPSFAGETAQWLDAQGVPMVPFRQGFLSMGPAVAALQRSIVGKVLAHPNNPILTWCATNVTAKRDEAGNEKFVKTSEPSKKIDCMVALAMAEGLLALKKGAAPKGTPAVHFL